MWKETNITPLRQCTIFDLYQSTQQAYDGQESNFYLLKSPDWVSVVPVLSDENQNRSFIMVKQYRFGIKQLTIEFPAGLANPGEAPEEAARRELLEETGHTCNKLLPALKLSANPSFMNNWVHFFIATGLEETSALQLDQFEKLEMVIIPEKELDQKIGHGEFINPQTFIAYQLIKSGTAQLSL